MNIGAQSDVVRKIPANVVRIVVDHNVIGIPEPVIAVIIIIRSDREEPAANGKAFGVSAMDPPDVPRTDCTGEMAMLPRMVEVVVHVIASAVMADPVIVLGVNVRSLGMPLDVIVFAVLVVIGLLVTVGSVCRCCVGRRRTMSRNMSTTNAVLASMLGTAAALISAMLRIQRDGKNQGTYRKSSEIFQAFLLECRVEASI